MLNIRHKLSPLWQQGLIFLLLSLGIVLAGWFYYRDQQKNFKAETQAELAFIADFKTRQISDWLRERMGDANYLYKDPFLLQAVEEWLKNPEDAALKRDITDRLADFRENPLDFENIYLVSPEGKLLLSAFPPKTPFSPAACRYTLAALKKRTPYLSDLHRHNDEGLWLGIFVPMLNRNRADSPLIALAVMRIDPYATLYPMLQSWPVPSKSGEILMVERQGDQVLFLNELRFRKNTALNLQLPLSRENLPAVMAITGKTGAVEGVDYRGMPVLFAASRIPYSPWSLVAKIDQNEVYAPLKEKAGLAALMVGFILLLGGLMLGIFNSLNQRRAEKNLKISELNYRRLFETAQDGILLLDGKTGKITAANPFILKLLKYTPAEMIGRELWEIGLIRDKELAKRAFNALQTESFVRYENLPLEAKDGEIRQVEFVGNIYEVDGEEVIHCNIRDISRSKNAEENLKISELNYRRLFETAKDGILLLDYNSGKIIAANPFILNLLKYSLSDMLDKELWEIGFIQDKKLAKTAFDILQKESYVRYECLPLETKDGNIRQVEFVSNVYEVDHEKVIQCNIRDITERKNAEQAERKSAEELRDLYDNAPCGYHTLDDSGKFIRINETELKWLGYSSQEIVGVKNFRDILTPESLKSFQKNFLQLEEQGWLTDLELELLRKDGSILPVLLNATAVIDNKGVYQSSRATIVELTKLKKLEKQVLHSQKMDAIGNLAAGIAHDFNNLLAAILGNLEMAKDQIPASSPAREDLQNMEEAALRAKDLVHQLLQFGRPVKIEAKTVNLNQAVEDSFHFLRTLIPTTIKVEKEFSPEALLVRADPSVITLIVTNLSINARDAMPLGGALQLKTEPAQITPEYAELNLDARPGQYCVLTISDTGLGMPPEVEEHIFEPFFTTKERERGTGLGLAMVYSSVKQMGGWINVYSESGKGTVFKIYLPTVLEANEEEILGRAEPVTGGKETILLADDEEALLELGRRILEKYGYHVLTANNAKDAVKLFKGNSGLELAILDLTMPGGGGLAAMEGIKQINPGLPVIICSGYLLDGMMEKARQKAQAYLSKPFAPMEMARTVRSVLDEARLEKSNR